MGITFGPTFATEIVNKLRWKPETIFDSNYYVTGSWCNDELNFVRLWLFPPVDDPYHEPVPVASYSFSADVTGMEFINSDSFVVSSSEGSVRMFNIGADLETSKLNNVLEWKNLHYLPIGDPCCCMDVANFGEDIVSVGEDGRINFLKAGTSAVFRKIDDADCCAIESVCFLTHNTVSIGNMEGTMKLWDVKSASNRPASVFMLEEEHVGVNCMTVHPTQRHILLVGTMDGRVIVWDLRNTDYPATMLDAHVGSVNELRFHPTRPEHLVSCSRGGELLHWNTSTGIRRTDVGNFTLGTVEENVWLQGDVSVQNMKVGELLKPLHAAINSIDLTNSRVACGCENQALYAFSGIFD